jgi:hypothetical protein
MLYHSQTPVQAVTPLNWPDGWRAGLTAIALCMHVNHQPTVIGQAHVVRSCTAPLQTFLRLCIWELHCPGLERM